MVNCLSFFASRWRRRSKICLLGSLVAMGSPRVSANEDEVAFKWQDYAEDDGRVRVISRYLGVEKAVSPSFLVKAHAVYDSISGATPTGAPSQDGGETVPQENLVDVREAVVVDFEWIHGDSQTGVQYAHSDEDDFLSKGYSLTHTTELNQKNTGITGGISYVDDLVRPFFFAEGRRKESWDAMVGLTQVLDPNTILTLNLTYGVNDGYLNDPYKITTQDVQLEPVPGVILDFPDVEYDENRPTERERRIVFANLRRFFPKLSASLDAGVRHFDDDWGIESQTLDLEWYQKIGDKWILRPKYRYYRQSAASFYAPDFDGADFSLDGAVFGAAPYFVSDYRLAKFSSETLGLKVIYKINDRISVDANYERYVMTGRDGVTSQDAFPSADIVTLGGRFWF